MSMENTDFSKTDGAFVQDHGYTIKRLLSLDDRLVDITHTRVQQLHLCPYDLNEEGKKTFTANTARQFLYRIASIGFGNVHQGRTKRITFKKNFWQDLNSFCRQTLTKLGITQDMWTTSSVDCGNVGNAPKVIVQQQSEQQKLLYSSN